MPALWPGSSRSTFNVQRSALILHHRSSLKTGQMHTFSSPTFYRARLPWPTARARSARLVPVVRVRQARYEKRVFHGPHRLCQRAEHRVVCGVLASRLSGLLLSLTKSRCESQIESWPARHVREYSRCKHAMYVSPLRMDYITILSSTPQPPFGNLSLFSRCLSMIPRGRSLA